MSDYYTDLLKSPEMRRAGIERAAREGAPVRMANALERIAAAAEKIAAQAPPLTDEQARRLRALLGGA